MEGPTTRLTALAAARHLNWCRRRRPKLFGRDDPADPAWDIMVKLFIGESEGRACTVTQACVASMVPPSTAARWINRLCKAGLVERRPDVEDRRRTPSAHTARA